MVRRETKSVVYVRTHILDFRKRRILWVVRGDISRERGLEVRRMYMDIYVRVHVCVYVWKYVCLSLVNPLPELDPKDIYNTKVKQYYERDYLTPVNNRSYRET